MKAIPETLKKMETISDKLVQWGINVNVLTELEEFPMSVSVINEDGTIDAVNQAFCEMTGYLRQELIGKPFTLIIPEDKQAYYLELHDKFMKAPFRFSGEYQVVDKKGQTIDLLVSISMLKIKKKKKRITLSLKISDQLDKRKLEIEKLGDLNVFISKLNESIKLSQTKLHSQEIAAGIVRHDLRNQLHNMISLSEMLTEHNFSEEEQKQMLRMITDSGKKALQEIDKSSSIELMERGEYKINLVEFDLMELIEEIHNRLKIYFSSKKLKLLVQSDNPQHLDGTQVPYFIHADKFFFELMFSNLLQNATEASPENETILIDIKSAHMSVEISIHNWGTVPKEIQSRFFEKYVTKGKKKGTGLGTYICKMIVDAHEGMINMRSDDERGTYVVVVFPKREIKSMTKVA
jgi:PAS domain S-box-containing protein